MLLSILVPQTRKTYYNNHTIGDALVFLCWLLKFDLIILLMQLLLVSSWHSDVDFMEFTKEFLRENSFLMTLKIFRETQTNIYQN